MDSLKVMLDPSNEMIRLLEISSPYLDITQETIKKLASKAADKFRQVGNYRVVFEKKKRCTFVCLYLIENSKNMIFFNKKEYKNSEVPSLDNIMQEIIAGDFVWNCSESMIKSDESLLSNAGNVYPEKVSIKSSSVKITHKPSLEDSMSFSELYR